MYLTTVRLHLIPNGIFDFIYPEYVNTYTLPRDKKNEPQKEILRKAHTVLLEYQEKGWDTHVVSLGMERLGVEFSDTHRKREFEAGNILLESYLVTRCLVPKCDGVDKS